MSLIKFAKDVPDTKPLKNKHIGLADALINAIMAMVFIIMASFTASVKLFLKIDTACVPYRMLFLSRIIFMLSYCNEEP